MLKCFALMLYLMVSLCVTEDQISEYTMEILEDLSSNMALLPGCMIYIAGSPNETQSTYEVHLTADKSQAVRIQYAFEKKGNGSGPPQDIIRYGLDMNEDLATSGENHYEVRSTTGDDIRTEEHKIFMRFLENGGYKVYYSIGATLNKIFNFSKGIDLSLIKTIGLQGEFKLRNYQHWKKPEALPYTYQFPTQANIFPQNDMVCVVADLSGGKNFTVDILGSSSSIVAFRWSLDIPSDTFTVSNNIDGSWESPKTANDCGMDSIAWMPDGVVSVTLSNKSNGIGVAVQIGSQNYTCDSLFPHSPSIDKNTGYRAVVVSGDVDLLQIARINIL